MARLIAPVVGWLFVVVGTATVALSEGRPPVSQETQDCIFCHASISPGIVDDWKRSRHAKTTPAEALKKPEAERRVSAGKVPENLTGTVVGCAECHTLNSEAHKDTFDHGDKQVHVLVSPKDCSTCHPAEAEQFGKNLMSHARRNLTDNKLYQKLTSAIAGTQTLKGMRTEITPPDDKTSADSCAQCHGTDVQVQGKETRETDQGEMEFPVLTGWPNQGVGRHNPDGSKGSCTACHSRHQFAIQTARQPYTCSQCHKGPDVPAYGVYGVSKHGNVFSAMKGEWDLTAVPWQPGKNFVAPTCATCHVSLLVNGEGDVISKRTHQMNDRLPWRIFGLPYAHPHPKSPDTTTIMNKAGLPLPTELSGEPVSEFLIDGTEQTSRAQRMRTVCRACHSRDWVQGQWDRFENTIKVTNQMTLTATQIVEKAWETGLADKENPFDEAIEKQWVEQWLFFGNSTRLASAMMGADYGVFANGRWWMAKNIQEMLDRFKSLSAVKGKKR